MTYLVSVLYYFSSDFGYNHHEGLSRCDLRSSWGKIHLVKLKSKVMALTFFTSENVPYREFKMVIPSADTFYRRGESRKVT